MTHVPSSSSTPSTTTSNITCLSARKMSMSITASPTASAFMSPSHIHVETAWRGSQTSASRVESFRWKFLMKTVKTRTQPVCSFDTLWLLQVSEKAEAMHMYFSVCMCVLCTLNIRNRLAPYGRWSIKNVKRKKKEMTQNPSSKNCHVIHAMVVETYLYVAFCSLLCGWISKVIRRNSRPL